MVLLVAQGIATLVRLVVLVATAMVHQVAQEATMARPPGLGKTLMVLVAALVLEEVVMPILEALSTALELPAALGMATKHLVAMTHPRKVSTGYSYAAGACNTDVYRFNLRKDHGEGRWNV